jgi:hypothetical protein
MQWGTQRRSQRAWRLDSHGECEKWSPNVPLLVMSASAQCSRNKILMSSVEEVLDLLDQSPLSAKESRQIAFEIVAGARLNEPFVQEMLSEYTNGFPSKSNENRLREILARLIDQTPARGSDQYKYRMLWCMLPTNEVLDGHSAEYYMIWAEPFGMNESDVASLINKFVLDRS